MTKAFRRSFNELSRGVDNYHTGVKSISPDLRAGKPVLAFVRNPFSWYVSWYYALQSRKKGSSVLFDLINTGNFDRDMHTLFDMFDEGKMVDEFVDRFTCPSSTEYADRDTFKQAAEWNNCGLLSWHYHSMLGDAATNLTVGKYENLVEDLTNFFKRLGISPPAVKGVKVNVTRKPHPDYRSYYTSDLIDRVNQKEEYIIDRYGYSSE